MEILRGNGPVAAAQMGMMMGALPWGEGHHAAFRQMFDKSAAICAVCEDLPEDHNRVTLDPDMTDSHGIPAPKINYVLGENSINMLAHAGERSTEVLRAAGASFVTPTVTSGVASGHVMGTTRMGTDPERSVVNEWGRSHDVKNLFVADSSMFVTSGGVNPTSTLQALARYVAANIKQRLANLFD